MQKTKPSQYGGNAILRPSSPIITNALTATKQLAKDVNTMSTRSSLYFIAKLIGDINAIRKGRIGKRIYNRLLGKALSRLFIRR